MKASTLYLVIILFIISSAVTLSGNYDRGEGTIKEKKFQETLDLVKSGEFLFEARRAFPMSGRSVDLTTNFGFINLSDSTTSGNLPFFGRAFHVQHPGAAGGINFSGDVENLSISTNKEKLNIKYSFEVKDYDHFRVFMEIGYDGNTSITVLSNHRSSISYIGDINPL